MREIQASEAKTHLPKLLDAVERGETIIITRHGRAIARVIPEVGRRQAEIEQAMDSMRAIRRKKKPISIDEILAWRDEGRK
jgi:prevent-host-death family protein